MTYEERITERLGLLYQAQVEATANLHRIEGAISEYQLIIREQVKDSMAFPARPELVPAEEAAEPTTEEKHG